jgi:putative ABC transport system permease protein
MTFGDTISGAFASLWAHKLRTGLTMFGIGWGIVSISLMIAAGEGLREGQKKTSALFGKDIMIFSAGRTSLQAGGLTSGRRLRWRTTDHLAIQPEATACAIVIPELGADSVPVRSAYNSASLMVNGSLPEFAEMRTIPVAEGRFYNYTDEREARRVAFLGADAKKQLFAERKAVGETISLGDFPYTVIGVMEFKEQDSSYDGRDVKKIFIPFATVARDFPEKPPLPPNSIDRLIATPKSIEDHIECRNQVTRALARLHRFDPQDTEAAFLWDTIRESAAFAQMANGMKLFLGAMGFVTLFLGGIGVMNVMLVAVRERTREIGVCKAVGATRHMIIRQFVIETMTIVFVSGFLGMGFAWMICALVNRLPMPMYFAGLIHTWQMSAVSLGVLGLVAILSALYPAARAASIDPIEALRYEAGG